MTYEEEVHTILVSVFPEIDYVSRVQDARKRIVALQPTHPVDGELHEEFADILAEYDRARSSPSGNSADIEVHAQERLEKLFNAHLQAAVQATEERTYRFYKKELTMLKQFQENVIKREALAPSPVVVCAGCAKSLNQGEK